MGREEQRLTRKELYDLVWKSPLTKLAQQYGLSDNGLRKICIKHKIPLPKSGHWAKLQYGKKTDKKPLTDLSEHEEQRLNDVIIYCKEKRTKSELEIDPVFEEVLVFENISKNKVTVKQKLTSPHYLVKLTKNALSNRRLDRYARIITKNQECLDIKVTRGSLKRALLILDSLIHALENREFVQKVYIENDPSLFVIMLDKKLRIVLKEKVSRLSEPKKIKYKTDKNTLSYLSSYNYDIVDYEGTGELTLTIEGGWGTISKKTWADKTNAPLEDFLNEFIIGLARVAAELIPIDRRKELEDIAREEQRQKNIKMEHQRLFEEAKFSRLITDAKKYNDISLIKKFIHSVEQNIDKDNFVNDKDIDMKKWLSWAKQVLVKDDPSMNFDFITYDEFASDSSSPYSQY